MSIKYDSIIPSFVGALPEQVINSPVLMMLFLIVFGSFMTSITNSLISLEGRNINILKSLPIKTKTILMSKIYACLIITTPMLLLGNIILFIRFKTSIISILLLLILSILMPLVSHFIGLIINLKFPNLDADNPTEVVKQSTSSFIAVLLGMLLLIGNFMLIIKVSKIIDVTLILTIFVISYLLIDIILYLYLSIVGVKEFNNLSV